MSKDVFVFEVSENNFAQSVIFNSHKLPVIVEFMAIWSEPCAMMADLFSVLANEFAGDFVFAKIDTDEQQKLRDQYNIKNLPTLIVFKDGEPVRTEEGQLQEAEARSLLKDFGIFRQSDALREQARDEHISGNTNEAILLLTQAIKEDPSNTRIAMDMTQIFIDIAQIEQAQSLFDRIPQVDKQTDMGKALSGQLGFAELAKNTPDLQTLSETIDKNPDDHNARFDIAVNHVALYNYDEAINELFTIMEAEPEFKDGAVKELIITITNMIAPVNYELAAKFRQRLANTIAS